MDASLWIPAALLALACAAFIFWPQRRLDYLRERRDVIYENIRDLNFEFRAGKYPEDDYLRQRESLENEAAGVLTEMDSLNA